MDGIRPVGWTVLWERHPSGVLATHRCRLCNLPALDRQKIIERCCRLLPDSGDRKVAEWVGCRDEDVAEARRRRTG